MVKLKSRTILYRIAHGGAQQFFGVTPDLTTLGKIIGGGLPVGAYGGRRDIMQNVAPAGTMYQVRIMNTAFDIVIHDCHGDTLLAA